MKQVSTMPASGNFVAVWQYNGQVWSTSYHLNAEGYYTSYNEDEHSYFDHEPDAKLFREHNAVFFVAG